MKKIHYYITAMMLIGLVACEKKLDLVPEGAPFDDNYWVSQENVLLASDAMYAFFEPEFSGRGHFWFINASDDMVTGRVKSQADNVKNFSSAFMGGDYTKDQWMFRYKIIRRANDMIMHAPSVKMDENLKKRVIGEAYFLSGLMYLELASNYGDQRAGVPIADREHPENVYVPRAKNVMENYVNIISDLQNAANRLPYFDELAPEDRGRAHKTAAWAYLAKTCLYAGQYDPSYYAKAELYADSVTRSGKHALLSHFEDVFKMANNWSKEYIWSFVSNPISRGPSILPGVMLENKGWGKYNGWGYYTPTRELYDEYEAGDLRRSITILKRGDFFTFFGETRRFDTIYEKPSGETVNSPTTAASKMLFRKYMEPFTYSDPIGTHHLNPSGDGPTTDLNIPILRYAEVILIKAEAKLKQSKNADAEINLIRARAGLPAKTNATMSDLKHERRCELAGEWSDRHRDLVRWGDAQATYAKPLHDWDGKVVWPARNFNPQVHHVWPVPPADVDASKGRIKQNGGW